MEFYNKHLKAINSIASSHIQLVVIPVKSYLSLQKIFMSEQVIFIGNLPPSNWANKECWKPWSSVETWV